MNVDIIEHPLVNMHQVTLRVKGNSAEGDAVLFDEAAKWCRAHRDYTVLQTALVSEIEPEMTSLMLFSES